MAASAYSPSVSSVRVPQPQRVPAAQFFSEYDHGTYTNVTASLIYHPDSHEPCIALSARPSDLTEALVFLPLDMLSAIVAAAGVAMNTRAFAEMRPAERR